MKFSVKDFFSKSDQIRSSLRVWSHLLKKSLTENLCAVFAKRREWMWMLSKFFVSTAFITKCGKITSLTLFGSFWKNLLQRGTNRKNFTNFKTIITMDDKKSVQSVTDILKWHRIYYKLWQLLQSLTITTKWDVAPSFFE